MEDRLKRTRKSLSDVIGEISIKKVKRENATHWRPCMDKNKNISNVSDGIVYPLFVDVQKTGYWIIDDNGDLFKISATGIGDFICFESDQTKLDEKIDMVQTLSELRTEESYEVFNENDKLYDLLRSELKDDKHSLRFVELIIKARGYGLTTQEELEIKEKCQQTIDYINRDFKQNRTISFDS